MLLNSLLCINNNNICIDKNKECEYVCVGSREITSDYDATLFIKDQHLADVLKNFYEQIKKYFGISSDVILDSNLYTTTYIIPIPYSEQMRK